MRLLRDILRNNLRNVQLTLESSSALSLFCVLRREAHLGKRAHLTCACFSGENACRISVARRLASTTHWHVVLLSDCRMCFRGSSCGVHMFRVYICLCTLEATGDGAPK